MMSLSTIEKVLFLKGVELFTEIHGEDLVPLARVTHEAHFAPGEVFIRQGDVGDCLYIVVDGEVDIVIQGVGPVAHRSARGVIGEMAVISQQARSADCVAVGEVTALRIDQRDFWELIEEQPAVARGVIKVLAQRLDEAVSNLQRVGQALSNHHTLEVTVTQGDGEYQPVAT